MNENFNIVKKHYREKYLGLASLILYKIGILAYFSPLTAIPITVLFDIFDINELVVIEALFVISLLASMGLMISIYCSVPPTYKKGVVAKVRVWRHCFLYNVGSVLLIPCVVSAINVFCIDVKIGCTSLVLYGGLTIVSFLYRFLGETMFKLFPDYVYEEEVLHCSI